MNSRQKLLSRRQQINEAIRQAAIDEFALNGLAGTSTMAIAKRAGLTKPQLHYYITSKEELYEDVLAFIVEEWTSLFKLSALSGDPESIIREYVRIKISYSIRFPNTIKVFTNEVARGAPVLSKFWDKSRAAAMDVEKLIQSWIDDGLIRPVDPLLFQMHIWAVTQSYADYDAQLRFMLGIDGDNDLDEERIVTEVTALFLRHCGLDSSD